MGKIRYKRIYHHFYQSILTFKLIIKIQIRKDEFFADQKMIKKGKWKLRTSYKDPLTNEWSEKTLPVLLVLKSKKKKLIFYQD